MKRAILAALSACLALLAVPQGAAATTASEKGSVLAALKAAREAPNDAAKLNAALAVLPKVIFKQGDANRTYYVWEGDQLLTASQVRTAIGGDAKNRAPPSQELVVMNINGQDVIWPKGQRALTYAVDRNSFPSKQRYDDVVKHLKTATSDWVQACPTCGVSFTHKAALDTGKTFQAVTFVVRYDPSVTEFVAAAFFPNDPAFRRQVIIASDFFDMDFKPEGVLRHELGHVLGYRHEHIQGVAGCEAEDDDWRPITPYDPHSVMHYMCGEGGSFDLQLRETDKQGHRQKYS